MLVGLILIAVGVIAIAQRLDIISGSVWSYTWPVILILLGLSVLWGRHAGHRRHGIWGWCGSSFPYQKEEEDKQ